MLGRCVDGKGNRHKKQKGDSKIVLKTEIFRTVKPFCDCFFMLDFLKQSVMDMFRLEDFHQADLLARQKNYRLGIPRHTALDI